MPTFENLNTALTTLATFAKATRDNQGDLTSLNTTAQGNLVAALNELHTELSALVLGAVINDSGTSATEAWSSQKIAAELLTATQNAIDAVVNGAPAAKDTLQELITFIDANEGSITTIITNQNARVAVDIVQSFTVPQQAQGRANINAAAVDEFGDGTIDFTANVNAILT